MHRHFDEELKKLVTLLRVEVRDLKTQLKEKDEVILKLEAQLKNK